MCSSFSKIDRNIARSFLNAPSNLISYAPIPMKNEHSRRVMMPSQSASNTKADLIPSLDFLPQSQSNGQLDFPTNTNIIPMYYDVIIDTVTDYDIFYPIAKQTKKYFYNSNNDQQALVSDDDIYHENPTFPRYNVQRLDEHAVSIDFPNDYNSTRNWSDHERLHPIKNVRFNDSPTWIPYSRDNIEISPQDKNNFTPIDQYYFHPETILETNNEDNRSSSVRYITTPFFWFRPVHNHNYAICIPTSRPSLHAYITSSWDPSFNPLSLSTPNPVRL